jgi:hypothetical protein
MGRSTIIGNGASTSTGTFTSATGATTGGVPIGPFTRFSIACVHPSTKQVAWKLQGAVGSADAWADLIVATSSTGSTISTTTSNHVVSRIRINVTANGSTGDVTTLWHIAGAVV